MVLEKASSSGDKHLESLEKRPSTPFLHSLREERYQKECIAIRDMPKDEFRKFLEQNEDIQENIQAIRNIELDKLAKKRFGAKFGEICAMSSDDEFNGFLDRNVESKVLRDYMIEIREKSQNNLIRNNNNDIQKQLADLQKQFVDFQKQSTDFQKQSTDFQTKIRADVAAILTDVAAILKRHGGLNWFRKFLDWNYTAGNTIATYVLGAVGTAFGVGEWGTFWGQKLGGNTPPTPSATTKALWATMLRGGSPAAAAAAVSAARLALNTTSAAPSATSSSLFTNSTWTG